MVALVGELEGMRVPQGRIPQGVVKEMPSYELFKYGSGTLLLLREGGLFVRVDGENDATKEVRIPGEEGPAVLRAVVSGQVPEGIASSESRRADAPDIRLLARGRAPGARRDEHHQGVLGPTRRQ